MKLSARRYVDLPIAVVHQRLTDFDGWQRAALRRGAEVVRTDSMAQPAAGMSWHAAFVYRGKRREVDLRLDEVVPPERMVFTGSGPNLGGSLWVELAEMSPRRTSVAVKLDLRPRTIVARLFIQSLKLARSKVEEKFRARVAQVLAEIERPGQAPRRGSAG